MDSKKIVLMLLMVFMAGDVVAAQNPDYAQCGIITWFQNIGGGQYRYLESVYPDAAAANSAFNAFLQSNNDYCDGGGDGTQGGGTLYETTYWRSYYAKHCTNLGVYQNHFAYPVVGVNCPSGRPPYAIPIDDSDSDSIPDNVDPFPDDDSPFFWEIFAKVYDSQGNLKGIAINVTKDGQKSTFIVGEYDSQSGDTISLIPNSKLYDQEDYKGVWGEDTESEIEDAPPDLWPEHEYKIEPLPEVQSDDGVDNQGETTNDLLKDVVTNTKATADNQGKGLDEARRQTEMLDDIRKNLIDMNKRQDAAQKEDEINYPSFGDAGRSDVQSAYDTVSGQMDGDVSGSVPEKTGLGDRLDGVLEVPSGVQGAYSESGVEVSPGSCSVSVTVLGRSITFSFCEYEDKLLYLGILFQGLAGLSGLMLIAGRG